MSLQSWKAVHYPKPAAHAERLNWLQCMDASILKWSGARKAALKPHDVGYVKFGVFETALWSDEEFEFVGDSCHLCKKAHVNTSKLDCGKCPIYKMLGKECWDTYAGSAYSPTKMLSLLTKVRKWMVRNPGWHK